MASEGVAFILSKPTYSFHNKSVFLFMDGVDAAAAMDPRDTWVWILLQPLGITVEVAGDSVPALPFPELIPGSFST